MKKLILIFIIFAFSFGAYAGFVKYEDAAKVAVAHYHSSKVDNHSSVLESLNIECVSNPNIRTSNFKFYVFDFQEEDNLGFVIVSSDNNIKPILSYSFEGNFNHDNISPAQKAFLDYYDACIQAVSTRSNLPVDEKVAQEWNYLLNYDFTKSRNSAVVTSKTLLDGITFDQPWPYNAMCPKDSGSKGGLQGHVPVGCAAVAACQVMKYYNWPPKGEGTKNHFNFINGGYGDIKINLDEETYNWDKIPVKASKDANDELAKICYHAGVAMGMTWGAQGSGVSTIGVVGNALKNHFRYSKSAKFQHKSALTDKEWEDLLISEIDANRPMVYQGLVKGKNDGHAWNCDGYQIKEDGVRFFHMNWGWSGSGNGYCTLDRLVSAALVGGDESNFVDGQGIVYKIYPESSADIPYPPVVQSVRQINGSEGSFADRSANTDYVTNSESTYVIKPDNCGTLVDLYFARFDLADGDAIYVYEGEGDGKKLLNSFNKKNPPIISNSNPDAATLTAHNALSLKFTTKEKGGAEGWLANYKVTNCKRQAKLMNTASATFTDGSGEECNYKKSTRCRWDINPTGAKKIKIKVNKLNLAKGDRLEIFRGKSLSPTYSIAALDSESTIGQEFEVGSDDSPIDYVTVNFIVQSKSPGAEGWELSYTSDGSIAGIEELLSNETFEISPNPGNNQSNIRLTTQFASNVKVSIVDLMGKTIGSKDLFLDEGTHEIKIDKILSKKLVDGVYFVSIQEGNKPARIKKFIVTK